MTEDRAWTTGLVTLACLLILGILTAVYWFPRPAERSACTCPTCACCKCQK